MAQWRHMVSVVLANIDSGMSRRLLDAKLTTQTNDDFLIIHR